MTQKEEECTICLEFIKENTLIGIIQPCGHYYHDHCVLQWSSNSNTCPTCRKLFYKIEVKRKNKPAVTLRSIEIQDKLLENDAINHIPREFVVPNEIEMDATNSQVCNNGICIICSSSDYRFASREMLMCGACNAQFHMNCLRLIGTEEEQTWLCPICDYQQEWIAPQNNFHLFLRNDHTRTRTSRNRIPRVSKNSRTIKDNSNIPLLDKRKPGLIIHNENDELDDDFLYDNTILKSKPIINGGVLLRKELEINQKLTEDEAQSWNLFEHAKSGDISSTITIKENSTNITRRRRKKLTPIETPTSQPLVESKQTSTRISGLIKQISNNNDQRKINHKERSFENLILSKERSVSAASSSGSSLNIIDNSSSTEQKKQEYILSLDQKIKIQKHVRNKLHPFYNSINKNTIVKPEVIIPNEQCYITINKNVSRKIYNYISNLRLEDRSVNMKKIEDIFNDDNTLKKIVDGFVNEELKKYIV